MNVEDCRLLAYSQSLMKELGSIRDTMRLYLFKPSVNNSELLHIYKGTFKTVQFGVAQQTQGILSIRCVTATSDTEHKVSLSPREVGQTPVILPGRQQITYLL